MFSELQQHCSRLSQKALGQIPFFKCTVHWLPMSTKPATMPEPIPIRSTQNQPENASLIAWTRSKKPPFSFSFCIHLCLNLSFAKSFNQSIVWKLPYFSDLLFVVCFLKICLLPFIFAWIKFVKSKESLS